MNFRSVTCDDVIVSSAFTRSQNSINNISTDFVCWEHLFHITNTEMIGDVHLHEWENHHPAIIHPHIPLTSHPVSDQGKNK